jgi:hypothetical protein
VSAETVFGTLAETMPGNVRDDAEVVVCAALSKGVHGGTGVVVAKTPTNL